MIDFWTYITFSPLILLAVGGALAWYSTRL